MGGRDMKNYFNSSERTRHIILLAMQTVAEEFTEIDAITPEERKMLLKIVEWVKKFNTSMLVDSFLLLGKFNLWNNKSAICFGESMFNS